MRPTAFSLLLSALAASPVHSWGFLGHRAVAHIATSYLLDSTKVGIQSLLGPGQDLVIASTWADYYAHTPAGRFSAQWHYIDANDDPPRYCEVQYDRDCSKNGGGCIVSALVNQTGRVRNAKLGKYEQLNALRWIIHFIGDIHQPLHTEHTERGGNEIAVLWNGKPSNLHHVWDTEIPQKAAGGATDMVMVKYADAVVDMIDSGKYANKKHAWIAGLDAGVGQGGMGDVETKVLAWANDANKYICSYVLQTAMKGVEVSGAYADGGAPIIEELIAKAGYRLGAWLNLIYAGTMAAEAHEQESVKLSRPGGIGQGLSGNGMLNAGLWHGQNFLEKVRTLWYD